MSLKLLNLDQQTRQYMIDEINRDTQNGNLYFSPRLLDSSHSQYSDLLMKSVKSHDDGWLTEELQPLLKSQESKTNKKTGKKTIAKVPTTAAETLAEGEFNRFYMRAICLRAISEKKQNVTVYRAKQVSNPRPESESKIDTEVLAEKLLNDLRSSIGIDTVLGIPSGPNSGLSVKL